MLATRIGLPFGSTTDANAEWGLRNGERNVEEILAAIPALSFAERQQVVRRAMERESDELSAEENAILDERLADFRKNPESGTRAESLKASVMQRLKPR